MAAHDEQGSSVMGVRMPSDLREAVERVAADLRIPASTWVRMIIAEALTDRGALKASDERQAR